MVPREAIPGRLGLLLTLFLCMINTLNKVSNNSPRATRGPTALVRWLIICLVFILFSLLEYAWILAVYHDPERNAIQRTIVKKVSGSIRVGDTIDGKVDHVGSNVPAKIYWTSARKIDHMAMIIFPCLFGLVTVIFWTVLYKI